MARLEQTPAPARDVGGKRELCCVLVVEDDELIRDGLAEILRAEGHVVATAADGEQGLARLRRCESTGLILTDVRMPGVDGDEMVRRIRADPQMRDLPVCVMTAEPDRTVDGADYQVTKPLDLPVLCALVRCHCRHRGSAGRGRS